ncbi:unnamed protein product [Didymodactylos carnosus]|uniref:F-box domain-containing protein n=1 Tax=Didymodactylos carnosus TaxID=1234261 RepID=A0A815U2L9_9BILA|nr:unnamed protein product [Didymodactylos carnosus]CAF1510691.1 unnamed protein product [Didymodactylos carnosus]CAF3909824.1 unnamed protein product [Didymodactylos carnosus]CAF4371463.1 unnamed protein product [Didymodactylos carnosus]
MSNTLHSVIELFSVELWRELFEYFNSIELWYSFRGLNRKIDAILDQTMLHLNFKKQGNYGYFMKKILPSMNVGNVRSLKLKNANEIQHFFSIYSLNSLIQLRLLSLDFMYSFNDNLFRFWNQLSSLRHLRLLKIMFWGSCSGPNNCLDEKEHIIRLIFNKDYCPLLKYFKIDTCGLQRGMPTIPSLITTTKTTNIKYLWIDSLTVNDLIRLLPAIQNVKSFHIDYHLCTDNEPKERQQKMTIIMPLMPKCIRLHLKLSQDITFEHVEYLLKHTPNLKDLFLWGWYHLLDANKWELLLSVQCPKLIKLELICTGPIYNNNFDQASDDFEQKCKITPFWLERNVTITDDEDFSAHDYRCDTIVRFNIKKVSLIQDFLFCNIKKSSFKHEQFI